MREERGEGSSETKLTLSKPEGSLTS